MFGLYFQPSIDCQRIWIYKKSTDAWRCVTLAVLNLALISVLNQSCMLERVLADPKSSGLYKKEDFYQPWYKPTLTNQWPNFGVGDVVDDFFLFWRHFLTLVPAYKTKNGCL